MRLNLAHIRWPGALLLALAAVHPAADQVYKSIDADGNVTYSSVPPQELEDKEVRTLSVDPTPDEASRREAQQRSRSTGARARQLEARQQAQRRQRAEAAAQARSLEAARRELDEANKAYDSDWRQRLRTGLEPNKALAERRRKAAERVKRLQGNPASVPGRR